MHPSFTTTQFWWWYSFGVCLEAFTLWLLCQAVVNRFFSWAQHQKIRNDDYDKNGEDDDDDDTPMIIIKMTKLAFHDLNY